MVECRKMKRFLRPSNGATAKLIAQRITNLLISQHLWLSDITWSSNETVNEFLYLWFPATRLLHAWNSEAQRCTLKQTTNELLNLKQSDLFYAATMLTGRPDSQLPTTKYYSTNPAPYCTTTGNWLDTLSLFTRAYEMFVLIHLLILSNVKKKVVTMFY